MKKFLIIVIILVTSITLATKYSDNNKEKNIDWENFEVLPVEESEQKYIFDNKEVWWNIKTGEVIERKNNVVTRCDQLPLASKYIGYSVGAGYLFQYGSNLYSVYPDCSNDTVKLVSKKVINVLDCNAYLTSDAFSNPVLLMTDGSLKGYIVWRSHLVDYPVN